MSRRGVGSARRRAASNCLPRLVAALLSVAVAVAASPARGQGYASLEARAKGFYDLLEKGQRDRASAEFPALEKELATGVREREDQMNTLRDQVVERDGDLEELYQTPAWKDAEIGNLVLAYHLAWVRYQGAQLTNDAARKKSLLRSAVEGFTRFTLSEEPPEVYAESLYGRGLAYMDLGENQKALADLNQAAELSRTAAKAKAAIAEVKRRAAGGVAREPEVDPNDPEVLAGKLGDMLARGAGGDAGQQKDATDLARGLAARGGQWPDRISTMVRERAGRSSWGLLLLGQLAVDRGRCGDVSALVVSGAEVRDAGRERWRPELLYIDAGCQLNGGKARQAADAFAALQREFPDSPRAREAAYYRFRALDTARAADPSLAPAFEEALTSYLSKFGKSDGGAEAHYLLGELQRERGDCGKATAEFAQVPAGPFATRARFGTLSCRVTALGAKTPPAERAELIALAQAIVKDAPPQGPNEELVARAALIGALAAAGASPPDRTAALSLLDGFETRYPAAKTLFPTVVQARLEARLAEGKLDAAATDLDAHLAEGGPMDPERRKVLARLGRDLATRVEHASPGPERDQALAMARRVYSALVAADGSPAERVQLAELELRAGDPARARALFDEILAKDATSAEALRGAARAAAAAGNTDAALGYWRRVVEASPAGGTAWYEARLAQVTLLRDGGRKSEACQVLRSSRGRSTSAGGDTLAKSLQGMEADVCR